MGGTLSCYDVIQTSLPLGAGNATGANATLALAVKAPREPTGNWLLGVGFGIVSSFGTALGTLLQKKAHNINDKLIRIDNMSVYWRRSA